MGNQILLDSLVTAQHAVKIVSQSQDNVLSLDGFYKISMICIACFNLCFAIYIFFVKIRKDNDANEKNRKISLLKSLVLDYNMVNLYEFFDFIDVETKKLQQLDLSDIQKKTINDKLIEYGKVLRQKFTDTLIAIDKKLYDEIIKSTDNLLDNFTEHIFDEGIILSHIPMFEQKITKSIFETKTNIIKLLFNYKGE